LLLSKSLNYLNYLYVVIVLLYYIILHEK